MTNPTQPAMRQEVPIDLESIIVGLTTLKNQKWFVRSEVEAIVGAALSASQTLQAAPPVAGGVSYRDELRDILDGLYVTAWNDSLHNDRKQQPTEVIDALNEILALRPEAAPTPQAAGASSEAVAYVPHCIADGEDCIVGEYRWEEVDWKPFKVNHPSHWECRPLYATPTAPAVVAEPSELRPTSLSEGDNEQS